MFVITRVCALLVLTLAMYLALAPLFDLEISIFYPWIYLIYCIVGFFLVSLTACKLLRERRRLATGMLLILIVGLVAGYATTANLLTKFLQLSVPLAVVFSLVSLKRLQIGLATIAALCTMTAGILIINYGMQRGAPTPTFETYAPALAQISDSDRIAADVLMQDHECGTCHMDIHKDWATSAHRFASFNNPAYRFTVKETRANLIRRSGSAAATKLCAGCHDPVPLLSGAFNDPEFDLGHPEASAGVTCMTCHAITGITSTRGNASYIIAAPSEYPFARTANPVLRWLNHKTIELSPALHKASLLRPIHRTPEFCGSCHKVHLPTDLNGYRWIRGQNHYDSFIQSGLSGNSARAYYYPDAAIESCATCHMHEIPSDDPAAHQAENGERQIHSHAFPGANTALATLIESPQFPAYVNQKHRQKLKDAVSVDLFAFRENESSKTTMLRPSLPRLTAGGRYHLDVVLANRRVGHDFTQGTSDSNQVWLELSLYANDVAVAGSGLITPSRRVPPDAYFVNAYQVDRFGKRIDRRNAEDIYATVYDHQIPPGAADVVQYEFEIPGHLRRGAVIELKVRLLYRKFDTDYLRLLKNDPSLENQLPITEISADSVQFEIGTGVIESASDHPTPTWRRWNDYGIGLLRKPGGRALSRAEHAFKEVAARQSEHGSVNLARTYLRQGNLTAANRQLHKNNAGSKSPWKVAWLQGQIAFTEGKLDQTITTFERILATDFAQARARGFNFSRDFTVRNTLANAYLVRGRRDDNADDILQAKFHLARILAEDTENPAAHYTLSQVHALSGSAEQAAFYLDAHRRYRTNETDIAQAINKARQDNLVNHAADPLAIYLLNPLKQSPSFGSAREDCLQERPKSCI